MIAANYLYLKKSIDKLVKILKENLGIKLLKNKKKINIINNEYILYFNQNTLKLKKEIIISENEFKYINNKFLDKYVYEYKLNKYYMVFNNDLNYIGYYERNKDFIYVKNKNNYIIPLYNIKTKILYLGLDRIQQK